MFRKTPILLLLTMLLVSTAFGSSLASPSAQSGPPNPPDVKGTLYLPLVGSHTFQDISGMVTDRNNKPAAGVTISDGQGRIAKSGSDGRYTLEDVPAGKTTLAAAGGDPGVCAGRNERFCSDHQPGL